MSNMHQTNTSNAVSSQRAFISKILVNVVRIETIVYALDKLFCEPATA